MVDGKTMSNKKMYIVIYLGNRGWLNILPYTEEYSVTVFFVYIELRQKAIMKKKNLLDALKSYIWPLK